MKRLIASLLIVCALSLSVFGQGSSIHPYTTPLWRTFLDGTTAEFQADSDSTTFFQILDADGGIPILNIDSTSERAGFRTTSPLGLVDAATGVALALVLGADVNAETRTNATRKFARIGMPHYLSAEEEIMLFTLDSDGSDNIVIFGGGSIGFNAATLIGFNTAANDTTVGGTSRMTIGSDGLVIVTGKTDLNDNVTVGSFSVDAQSILHVYDTDGLISLQNANSAVGGFTGLRFKGTSNTESANYWNAGIFFERTNTGFLTGGKLHFAMDATALGAVAVADAKMTLLQTGELGLSEPDPETLLEMTHVTPNTTEHNSTYENIVNGRESAHFHKGHKADGTEHTLVKREASHDDSADDYGGKYIISTHTKAIGGGVDVVTEAFRIDSSQNTIIQSLVINERSSDPSKPSEGTCILWLSDGTGYGDDGDMIIASTVSGVTRRAILWNYDAGDIW